MSAKTNHQLSFHEIWNELKVQEQYEDAHRELLKAYDDIKLATKAHSVVFQQFRKRLMNLADKCRDTNLNDSAETEAALAQHQTDISSCSDEIINHCDNIVTTASDAILEAVQTYSHKQEEFNIRKKQIKHKSLEGFDNIIIEQFQKWRFEEIRFLQQRIHAKMKKNVDRRIKSFMTVRYEQFEKNEKIAQYQEKITNLQQQLFEHPLHAQRRINVYNEEIAKLKENVKILQKQLKAALKDTDTLSRSTSCKTSKDTQRTRISSEVGVRTKRRSTIYEQIFKQQTHVDKAESHSEMTDNDV